MTNVSPGKKLQNYFLNLYLPLPENIKIFLQEIDRDLMAEGEFVDLVYRSSINYLVRRLITTAQFFKREYPPEQYGAARYKIELRTFLRDYTKYTDRCIDELVALIIECLNVSGPTTNQKRIIKRTAERGKDSCYLCGCEIDYTPKSNNHDAASVDHIWPYSLGGNRENENLKIACRKCDNHLRQNRIDDSDYHYEIYSLPSKPYEREDGKTRMELAVLSRTNHCCSVCEEPAYRVGELFVGRIDTSDSWHFLNLTAYCAQHKPNN